MAVGVGVSRPKALRLNGCNTRHLVALLKSCFCDSCVLQDFYNVRSVYDSVV